MEFQRNPHLKLTIFLIVTLHIVHSQIAGTDCNGKTYFCVDDQQFQVCMDLPGGKSETVDDIVYPCPSDTFCDNAGQLECDSQMTTNVAPASTNNALPSSTTTLTEASFSCTQPGRFPDGNDCHRYYTCTKHSSGLRQTDSSCSFGRAFDPVSQRCTSDQSPCQPTFTCESSGRFPDPSDSGRYFWCLRRGSSYTMYHMSCSSGQSFDPIKGQCSILLETNQDDVGAQAKKSASSEGGACCNCCILANL